MKRAGGWLKRNMLTVIGGGLALLLVLFIWLRRDSGGTSVVAPAAGPLPVGGGGGSGPAPSPGAPGVSLDEFNELKNSVGGALAGLEQTLRAAQQADTATLTGQLQVLRADLGQAQQELVAKIAQARAAGQQELAEGLAAQSAALNEYQQKTDGSIQLLKSGQSTLTATQQLQGTQFNNLLAYLQAHSGPNYLQRTDTSGAGTWDWGRFRV